jgi:hypothetical protein
VPFTASHPAAVLPLVRLGLMPSALVIGSMVPDLSYYLPIPVNSAVTHSAIGIPTLDLLLGLLSFAIWWLLVAPLAVALASAGLRARLPVPAMPVAEPAAVSVRPWRRAGYLLMLVLSLSAGATTHVVWDEFTHVGRFGYRHVAWLADPHGPLPGYRWAQYGSTVLGAVVIVLALHRWWGSAPVTDPAPESALSQQIRVVVRALIVLAGLAGAVTGGAWAVLYEGDGLRRALFLIATWGGGSGLVTVLLVAVLWSLPRSPLRAPASPAGGG